VNPVAIRSIADIPVALGVGMESGGVIVDETRLSAAFFDLASGFTGEVLQRFTNHRVRLAVVVADPSAYGSRFSELAYEHRNHASVRFFADEQLARRWLAYNPIVKC
jgi:hypothetical protein